MCMQKASSGKLEDQEVGDLVNGIDPLWVLVDRVIARQEKQGRFCCTEMGVVPHRQLQVATLLYFGMQAQALSTW